MLSTGLFIGSTGGAVASADTDTGNDSQTSSSQHADGHRARHPVSRPFGRGANSRDKAVRDALRDVTGTLGSIRSQVQQHSAITSRPKTSAESTSTATAPSPTTEPTASTPVAAIPTMGPAVPTSNGTGAVPTTWPPVANPFEPAAKAATAVTNVATSVGTAIASVPGLVLSLPTSQTPVTDVITSLQDMLTSVTGSAIPLTQLPADFAAILIAGWNTPSVSVGHPGTALASPTDALLRLLQPSQSTSAATMSATRSAPSTASVAGLSALAEIAAVSGVNHEFVPPGTGVDTARASDAGPSFLKGAATALLISVSLWALITAALPGLGGLAAIGATGIRIGYRQAKAGIALRTTDLARFAVAGPIGVVRSDSLIVMRPRTLHDVLPEVRDDLPEVRGAVRPELRVLRQVA